MKGLYAARDGKGKRLCNKQRSWRGIPPTDVDLNAKQSDRLPTMSDDSHQRLQELRTALLSLHKTLVDSERVSYEATVGSIQSPNHFLNLLMNDPWFAWLQPLSQLIVAMDEALDAKEPLTDAGADAFMKKTSQTLVATEVGEGFSRHYFDALQRDPDVVLAQSEVSKLIRPQKSSK